MSVRFKAEPDRLSVGMRLKLSRQEVEEIMIIDGLTISGMAIVLAIIVGLAAVIVRGNNEQ